MTRRKGKKHTAATGISRPRIFVASSSEGLPIARTLARWIEESGGVAHPWKNAFAPGDIVIDKLIQLTRDVDGAVVVGTPDDKTTRRGRQVRTPRDNILLELGIFMTALSPQRTALVSVTDEEGRKPVWPKDIDGLTYLEYDANSVAIAESKFADWIQDRFFVRRGQREAYLEARNGKPYTWDDTTRGVEHIQHLLEANDWAPDMVLGLGRSGGVIGGLLASYLGSIPFRTLDLTYRTTDHGYDVAIEQCRRGLSPVPRAKRVLVVEGATTGGLTPKKAERALTRAFPRLEFKFAILIQTATSNFHADYFAFLERSTLKRLPWHGPLSRTFLVAV